MDRSSYSGCLPQLFFEIFGCDLGKHRRILGMVLKAWCQILKWRTSRWLDTSLRAPQLFGKKPSSSNLSQEEEGSRGAAQASSIPRNGSSSGLRSSRYSVHPLLLLTLQPFIPACYQIVTPEESIASAVVLVAPPPALVTPQPAPRSGQPHDPQHEEHERHQQRREEHQDEDTYQAEAEE
ncbi:hypothetical protein SELMODRAFT_403580 [Selaginella moellendorffii]|uniref:Uncharacterized protein n=1 Tax=Selaginella moellendorffii TaxID=88036 RepID=D8QRV3_SELML|nr:hypothetical protein SELMODRAFT_403580 [Selaginella moellendorffii]